MTISNQAISEPAGKHTTIKQYLWENMISVDELQEMKLKDFFLRQSFHSFIYIKFVTYISTEARRELV